MVEMGRLIGCAYEPHIVEAYSGLDDLPWEIPTSYWKNKKLNIVEMQHGVSRHPIIFLKREDIIFVIKELPQRIAQSEFELLTQILESRLPCVEPVGYTIVRRESNTTSILITRYLEASVPYRMLFINKTMEQYQNHLLDAISGLMVQLHTNGYYWGDCSLSNILFRRDAGALQAYLVDAETVERHPSPLSPMLRYHDLEILGENITGELTDLQVDNYLPLGYPIETIGSYVQQGYRKLWEEITKEEKINPNELFKVEERIRAINSLGFSVKEIDIDKDDMGNNINFRIFVSDRNFHRDQLLEITGIHAEERQAQQILNEINEIRAHQSQINSSEITLQNAVNFWKEEIFNPVVEKLTTRIQAKSLPSKKIDIIELYCQVLEHKWYLSERAQHDVGHQAAVDDFIQQFA
jgi:tRNA A-37 threonylcarbamoyl transferase component Bud32